MSTTGLDSDDQPTAEISNVRHLRASQPAHLPAIDEVVQPEAKARPDDLMPATPPPAEESPAKQAPKGSTTRRVLFALLPVMLVAGGYFYVTGGAVMSTDNAYVQAGAGNADGRFERMLFVWVKLVIHDALVQLLNAQR